MTDTAVLEIGRQALQVAILVAMPMLLASLVVGIVVSLVQVATSLHDATLTFVPKILAILIVLSFAAPFVGAVIFTFAEQTYARIPNGF